MLKTPSVRFFQMHWIGAHMFETMVHLQRNVRNGIEHSEEPIIVHNMQLIVLSDAIMLSVECNPADQTTHKIELFWVEQQLTATQSLHALQKKIETRLKELQPESQPVIREVVMQAVGKYLVCAVLYYLVPFCDRVESVVFTGFEHQALGMSGAIIDLELLINQYLHEGEGPRGVQLLAQGCFSKDKEISCLLFYRRRT